MGASPLGVDWDNDGDFDLISGENNGRVTLFTNIGTATSPVLTNSGYIRSSGTTIDVGSLSIPEVCDWDEDGRKDLVMGCDAGYVYVYLNTGTDANPSFTGSFRIQANGSNIMKNKNCPRIVDLNEDGKKDLVLAWIEGSCLFWPNKGTNASPVFEEMYELLGYTDPVDPEPGNYNWSHFCVTDWDEDGHTDMIYTRWESDLRVHLHGSHNLLCDAEPINPPIVIPAQGGSFRCRLTLSNTSAHDAVIDAWTEVVLPSGALVGPVRLGLDQLLTGGGNISVMVRENVPAAAPPGTYTYRLCIGKSGNGYFVADSFDLQKL